MAVDRQSFLCRGPSTIWPLAGNSRVDWLLIWRMALMKERQGASHLAQVADDESRADEWISGSIQKTAHSGNECSHTLSIRGAVPRCLWLQVIETIVSQWQKELLKPSPSVVYFPWYSTISSAPLHKRSEHIRAAVGTDWRHCGQADPSLNAIWKRIHWLDKLLIFLLSLTPVATYPHPA